MEEHTTLGWGVSMGRGVWEDQRDQSGGARRAEKHGEGSGAPSEEYIL
jgi:hypothetical protein